jgi:hypothetical protein
LDAYGRRPSTVPKNGELLYKCINPKCNSHNKRKDKFCVNIEKENAHCWVCNIKIKNIAYLIKRYASKLISEWNEVSGSYIPETIKNIEVEKVWYDDVFRNTIPLTQLSKNHSARKYVHDVRGIDIQTAVKFDIRYADQINIDNKVLRRSICIPSYSVQGGIDFLFFRSIDTNFKYNCKTSKKEIIFNESHIDWKGDIALSEGIFDAIKLSQRLQTIPLLGSTLSEDSKLYKKIIREKPRSVTVCLDPDALAKQRQIMLSLYKQQISVYSMETEYNDLGDSTPEEIENAIRNIKLFDSDYNIRMKLRLI